MGDVPSLLNGTCGLNVGSHERNVLALLPFWILARAQVSFSIISKRLAWKLIAVNAIMARQVVKALSFNTPLPSPLHSYAEINDFTSS